MFPNFPLHKISDLNEVYVSDLLRMCDPPWPLLCLHHAHYSDKGKYVADSSASSLRSYKGFLVKPIIVRW